MSWIFIYLYILFGLVMVVVSVGYSGSWSGVGLSETNGLVLDLGWQW